MEWLYELFFPDAIIASERVPPKPCPKPVGARVPLLFQPIGPPNPRGISHTLRPVPPEARERSFKSTKLTPQDGQIDPKMAQDSPKMANMTPR
jgi:hypothetical protein